jgi:nitrogenase subunit NifH
MELVISLLLSKAAGYILKGAAQSKAVENAKEEVLGKFWNWIKPKFIKEVPEIEDKPDSPETETKTQERLLELVKDETFFEELAQQVATLQQAGITEKNIVKKSLVQVKKVHIGDKVYAPTESYDRKNIVEGEVKNVDEFILGDGH